MKFSSTPPLRLAFCSSVFLALGSLACSSDDSNDSDDSGGDECSGHGELHDDHCDCDVGYEQADDDALLCIEIEDKAECGGHAELHGDHCECDDGYVLDEDDETVCVEEDDDPVETGGTGGEGHGDAHDLRAARLAISDGEEGKVTVVSLATGEIVASFELDGPASIYSTESGRFAALTLATENKFSFLDSGLILEEHGDHFDRLEEKPQLLEFELLGSDYESETPVHFVSHAGYLTFHFDGIWDEEGDDHVLSQNIIIDEGDLLEDDPEPTLVLESLPQHGVSMVTESGHVLMTEPSSDRDFDTLPNGISVRSLEDGEVSQLFHDGDDFDASCWGLHGEALLHGDALFGCHQANDGGALLIRWDEDEEEFASSKLEYPGFPDAPNRTSVIISHPQSDYFVGQWGTYAYPVNMYDGMVRISPDASKLSEDDTLELGEVYCSFGFEQAKGKLVAALTRDGKVHVVDVPRWELLGSVDVVEDLSEDEACAGSLTMGDGFAYVSESSSGTVFEVNVSDLEVERSFEVGGSPSGLAVLGYFGVPGQPAH